MDLVCCKADGSPLIGYNVSRRFTTIAKSIKLYGVSCHSLRHTFATLLLEAGVPINDVSQMLGHAKPETTDNIYGHAIPRQKKNAAKIMTDIVHGRDSENGSKNEWGTNGVQNGGFPASDNVKTVIDIPRAIA